MRVPSRSPVQKPTIEYAQIIFVVRDDGGVSVHFGNVKQSSLGPLRKRGHLDKESMNNKEIPVYMQSQRHRSME